MGLPDDAVSSLYHEVGFIPGSEEWKTSVPGEPPGFSCTDKGLSDPFQPSGGWYLRYTTSSLTITMLVLTEY